MNFLSGPFAAPYNAHTIGVRAEHIEFRDRDPAWTGTVIHSEILGSDSFVYLDIGSAEPLIVRETGVSSHQPGQQLGVSPINGCIHRFDQSGRALERVPFKGAA